MENTLKSKEMLRARIEGVSGDSVQFHSPCEGNFSLSASEEVARKSENLIHETVEIEVDVFRSMNDNLPITHGEILSLSGPIPDGPPLEALRNWFQTVTVPEPDGDGIIR